MRRIVLLVLGLIILPLMAAAYQVNIEAPETLTVGKPLVVTGTTTFGIGTPIDVVLYYQMTTTTEVKRKIAYIQPDKTFKAVFDTTGLKTGTYKVEVPTSGMGGDSVTMRVVQIIDRSDAIHISSSLSQPFTGVLIVAGTVTGGENSGIQVEVVGPGGDTIFGPRFVNTNYLGDFEVDVPVNEVGDFVVSITDSKGYLGEKTFTVLGMQDVTLSPGNGPTPTSTPGLKILSAHARASRSQPAYFTVRTGNGPVTLYTSSSLDWVMEYVDERGERHTVNNNAAQAAERISLVGSGKSLYVMVYPDPVSASGEVYLYGQNVQSVVATPQVPEVFAPPATASETPGAPLFPLISVIAIGIVALFLNRT